MPIKTGAKETDKYFTPDITDIRVGYECEINFGGKGFVPYKVKGTLLFGLDALSLERDVRVPYLTKEQIEAEGWKLDFSRHVTPGIIYYKEEFTCWHIDNNIWIRKGDETLFKGECKDINTFRYITKLLGI